MSLPYPFSVPRLLTTRRATVERPRINDACDHPLIVTRKLAPRRPLTRMVCSTPKNASPSIRSISHPEIIKRFARFQRPVPKLERISYILELILKSFYNADKTVSKITTCHSDAIQCICAAIAQRGRKWSTQSKSSVASDLTPEYPRILYKILQIEAKRAIARQAIRADNNNS